MAYKRKPYQPRHLALTREQKKDFVAEYHGVFTRIARALGFSRTYVQQVFWRDRDRHDEAIDRMLDVAVFANKKRRAA